MLQWLCVAAVCAVVTLGAGASPVWAVGVLLTAVLCPERADV